VGRYDATKRLGKVLAQSPDRAVRTLPRGPEPPAERRPVAEQARCKNAHAKKISCPGNHPDMTYYHLGPRSDALTGLRRATALDLDLAPREKVADVIRENGG
jgi:hypothetical protein